jgi:hypothetical protein
MFEFDPSIDGPTPEHVRWTLVHDCPLRAGTDVSNPDQTERLLRALPYVSRASGAIVDGLVLQDRLGGRIVAFDSVTALAPFGGADHVAQCCETCVANVEANLAFPKWAGCHGTVSLPVEGKWRELVMRYMDEPLPEIAARLSEPRVTDRWFHIWAMHAQGGDSRNAALGDLRIIASSLWRQPFMFREPTEMDDWLCLALALGIVTKHAELKIALSVHPGGVVSGRTWQVDPHCSRCKASWWNDRRKTCEKCGHDGGRQASRTRKRIGLRPFRPIEEFVPSDQLPAVIEQWRAKTTKPAAE